MISARKLFTAARNSTRLRSRRYLFPIVVASAHYILMLRLFTVVRGFWESEGLLPPSSGPSTEGETVDEIGCISQ